MVGRRVFLRTPEKVGWGMRHRWQRTASFSDHQKG